jgi:hypothetical protein
MRCFSRTGYNIISAFILLFICFNNNLSYAQIKYTASGQRDPFENQLPFSEPEPEPEPGVFQEPEAEIEVPKAPVVPPEITVDGIVSGGTIPQAVIRQKVVRVGDTVEGARITKITKEGVEIVYQGETFMFSSPSKTVKPGQGGKNVLR